MEDLDTRPLTDRVYDKLLNEILYGKLKNGIIISTRDIAQKLNISEMPIRLSLKKLEYEGIVEIKPRSNCRIIGPTQKTIKDIFETRRILESYAIRKIYKNISDKDLCALSRYMGVMGEIAEEHFVDEKFEKYLKNDYAFHTEICRIADNNFVIKFHREINLHLSLNIAFSIINISHLKSSHADHCKLFAELEKRSSNAVQYLEDHLDRIQNMVMNSEVYKKFEKK